MTKLEVAAGINLIGEGFFAKRVFSLLSEEVVLTEKEKEVLDKAYRFLNDIKEGHHQVTTGELGGNASKSVEAYNRAMITMSLKGDYQDIEDYVEKMKSEIRKAKDRKKMNPEKVKLTCDFFKQVRSAVVVETGRHMTTEREIVSWKLVPTLLQSSGSL